MIPYVLAVIACCLAGALGGYSLARPLEALTRVGLTQAEGSTAGLAAARGLGGLLLLSHAGTAALLGYSPYVGASLALALSLMWAGAAVGRAVSTALDGPGDGQSVQNLIFEALMGVTLSLPFWASHGLLPGRAVYI
ncbi:MAG: DUF4345 domain-containing protein [Caulobacter sp.]|nr:DUF4345 domain-containing protein [Caulobacter sp.]